MKTRKLYEIRRHNAPAMLTEALGRGRLYPRARAQKLATYLRRRHRVAAVICPMLVNV